MTKKKPGAKKGRPTKAELERRRQQSQQSPQENRIQLADSPEATATESPSPESSSGSTEPSATSAATDSAAAFENAINEVGNELKGEFATVASDPNVAAAAETIIHEEVIDDSEWIKEVVKPENVKLYLEFPFDGAAIVFNKPHLSLKPHEVNLLAPLVRKWCKTLLESSDSPEFAAFMMFLLVYGTRVAAIEGLGELKEWLPKIQGFLGLGTQTPDSPE